MSASNTLWFSEITDILREAYPKAKLPSRVMPDFMVKFGSIFDTAIKSIVPDLGTFHEADANYVTAMTGVMPRPAKTAILAAAESLCELGHI